MLSPIPYKWKNFSLYLENWITIRMGYDFATTSQERAKQRFGETPGQERHSEKTAGSVNQWIIKSWGGENHGHKNHAKAVKADQRSH